MQLSLFISHAILGCTLGVAAVPVLHARSSCSDHSYDGPVNAGFETGTLDGWTVVSGDAFGSSSVSDSTTFWGGPFGQAGDFFLWGYAQNGDGAVGQLKSSSFQASNVMSFLIGGGYDPDNVYVALVLDSDGSVLLQQTPQNDEALIRIVWDTSAWAGQVVHLLVVDDSTAAFGHINLDDVRTGCAALSDNGLTFNVLGQSNQPAAGSEEACSLYAADPLRPQFHYTPYQGWINDPAGLIQWNGNHHLFSQYNPVEAVWGPMHWAHAESTDAVHWRELPVALYPPYPSNYADTSGRYTGSAARDNATGELRLIFTDYTDTAVHPDAVQEVVSTAVSTDGTAFTLDSNNPIIADPPANSASGFRDPKVFWDTIDSVWKLVVGSGDSTSGKVHLYRSTDLVDWAYVGVLYEGDGSTGTMWECPNFFPLDGKWVLFYGGRSLGWYHIGTYDGTTFVSETSGLVDAGPDSYAMQWYVDEAGRNLAITWMGNWDTYKWPSRVNGWAGQQSITRELFIRDNGGLGSKPIAELASLASSGAEDKGPRTITSTATTVGSEQAARLQLEVDISSTTASSFTVSLFSSAAESVVLTYFVSNQTLILDTTNAGYGQAGTWWAIVDGASETLGLDLFIDRSSLEIFTADGTVFTATVWPRYEESRGIQLQAQGGSAAFTTITLTPLGSSWC